MPPPTPPGDPSPLSSSASEGSQGAASDAPRALVPGDPVETIRTLLHPALVGVPEPWAQRAIACRVLRSAAQQVGLSRATPVIAGRLRDAGLFPRLEPSERGLAETVLAAGASRAASVRELLAAVARAAARAGARVHLVKGAALHGLLYTDPSVRPSGDVDAFVEAAGCGPLHRELLREGFHATGDTTARVEAHASTRGSDAWLLDLGYVRPGDAVALEVKADPIGIGPPVRRLEELSKGGRPSPTYPGLWIPSAEVMVLQQAFSLARRPGLDLLAHAELAATLRARRAELDPVRVLDLLEGEGLYGLLRSVLSVTASSFPGTVPPLLLRHEGRPAGFVPSRARRSSGPHASRGGDGGLATRLSFWACQTIGGRRPLASARWLVRRALPPEPFASALGDADARGLGLLRWMRRLTSLVSQRPRGGPPARSA